MKISISSFVYFNYPLEEAIKRISTIGYQGIEIWGGRPHAYRNDLSERQIKNIRGLIDKGGLEISAFIPAQFRYPTSLCSPDSKVRKDSVQYIKDSIMTALKLGTNKVSLCPGHTLYGQGYENGMKQLSQSIREIHAFAYNKGVILYIEPAHRFESDLILTVKDGLKSVSELNLENLGVVMDTGHCHVNNESLTECVSLLQGIPYHVHIDDNFGKSDDHKIPGEGDIDYLPFFRELKKNDYDGFLTVELGWNYTLEPDEAAAGSIRNIQSLLSGI